MTKLKSCGFILNAWLICATEHKQYKQWYFSLKIKTSKYC